MELNTIDKMNLLLHDLQVYCKSTGSSPGIGVTESERQLFLKFMIRKGKERVFECIYHYGGNKEFVLEDSLDGIFKQMNGRMCSTDDVKVLGILLRKINIKIKQEIEKKQNEINEFNSHFEG